MWERKVLSLGSTGGERGGEGRERAEKNFNAEERRSGGAEEAEKTGGGYRR